MDDARSKGFNCIRQSRPDASRYPAVDGFLPSLLKQSRKTVADVEDRLPYRRHDRLSCRHDNTSGLYVLCWSEWVGRAGAAHDFQNKESWTAAPVDGIQGFGSSGTFDT